MTRTESDSILPADWLKEHRPFEPFARYCGVMDQVTYLDENTAYRAERVDSFLTLYWAPDEWRLVGFKLKGFRILFDTLKNVSPGINEGDFVPFTKLFELAAFASWEELSKQADSEKLRRRYELAKDFVNDRGERMRISDLNFASSAPH